MWVEQRPSGRFRGGFRTPTGRKVQRTFDYEYEAEAWAVEAEERARLAALDGRGEPPAAPATTGPAAPVNAPQIASHVVERPAVPTVAEYAARFLAARKGHVSVSTWEGYEIHLRLGVLADPDLAATRLDDLTREAVDAWLGGLLADEVGRPTVNRRLKIFRIMLNYAIDNDVILRDPTRKIGYLPTDLREIRVVDREEEERLLAQCTTPEHRAQILLALDAGLRWGEVSGLPVSAISGDYLTVRQVYDRGTRKIRAYPKGKRSRVVPMTPRLREALAVVALVAEVRGPDALLFSSIVGGEARPMDPHNWHRDMWRGITHRARVNRRGDRLHFHDLRHTYGSRLAGAGVPRSEIATLMGHADEATTAIYIHAGDDGRRLDLVTAALVG